MRKNILLIALLLIITITGCSENIPELNISQETVNNFIQEYKPPETVRISYNATDGIKFLQDIKDNATTSEKVTWLNVNDQCILKGKFDDLWVYGYGTKDKMLMITGPDKEVIQSTMEAYMKKFTKK